MHFSAPYPTISLDTIANFATYHLGQPPKGQSPKEQSPKLRGNQSHRLLTLIITKWFIRWPQNIYKGGNPFHARVQASHAALGDTLGLSREWVCTLIARLRDAKYITTEAPRLPDGTQEITTFRLGKKLKDLLIRLVEAKQRNKTRVNDPSQKFPTKQEQEEKKALFAGLIAEIGEKFSMKKAIKW